MTTITLTGNPDKNEVLFTDLKNTKMTVCIDSNQIITHLYFKGPSNIKASTRAKISLSLKNTERCHIKSVAAIQDEIEAEYKGKPIGLIATASLFKLSEHQKSINACMEIAKKYLIQINDHSNIKEGLTELNQISGALTQKVRGVYKAGRDRFKPYKTQLPPNFLKHRLLYKAINESQIKGDQLEIQSFDQVETIYQSVIRNGPEIQVDPFPKSTLSQFLITKKKTSDQINSSNFSKSHGEL